TGGRLGLRLGKFGAFIGCSNYPECKYTRKLAVESDTHKEAPAADGPLNLGTDPASGEAVTLRKGPYGFYVQLGEGTAKQKPKRVSLPKEMDAAAVTLATALGLLSLPREVGRHPETGKMITAGIGRFGPYLEHDGAYASLGGDEDVLAIGLHRAVDLLQGARSRKSPRPLRVLGTHPEDGKPVTLHKGRYGPYVKHGRINASVPKDKAPETLSFEDALALVAARAAKGAKTRKKTGKKRTGTGARPSAG
ncbi:MAG: topoisomerase C-terminal repeat-containing protein, partial [Alphaproteobacteria bacterium]